MSTHSALTQHASIQDWAAALEASPLAEWMRGSAYAYPAANIAHLLGLVLLVGSILFLDLRLLGRGRQLSLAVVYPLLTSWALAGLVLLIVAGIAMFTADTTPLLRNPTMRLKLAAIALALGNALLFNVLWRKRLAHWDSHPPRLGRAQACFSLLIWLTTAALGRLIAYS